MSLDQRWLAGADLDRGSVQESTTLHRHHGETVGNGQIEDYARRGLVRLNHEESETFLTLHDQGGRLSNRDRQSGAHSRLEPDDHQHQQRNTDQSRLGLTDRQRRDKTDEAGRHVGAQPGRGTTCQLGGAAGGVATCPITSSMTVSSVMSCAQYSG